MLKCLTRNPAADPALSFPRVLHVAFLQHKVL